MIRRFLPLILVLAPAGLGGLARLLAILDGNATFTATAGIVAPQEVANTLSGADEALAYGIQVSILATLVWLVIHFRKGGRVVFAQGLVLAGLSAATWGTLELSALNSDLARDFSGVVSSGSDLSPEEATSRADEQYRSSYQMESPVHSSIQLAGLTGTEAGSFVLAHRLRMAGLLFAIAAAVLAARQFTDGGEESVRTVPA